ncbi:hypothetical protein Salat_2399700 [Sesamum alatum]|uniref:Uncharacterized protein n=1 Tax=Sesamum alatum TaxID=300844 RepID=A0AAE2CF64_9LAMI|nr:hypothetical protein Salat_2399700 [Sesamum alatum]
MYENYKGNSAKLYFLDVFHALCLELVHVAEELDRRNMLLLGVPVKRGDSPGKMDDEMRMIPVEESKRVRLSCLDDDKMWILVLDVNIGSFGLMPYWNSRLQMSGGRQGFASSFL